MNEIRLKAWDNSRQCFQSHPKMVEYIVNIDGIVCARNFDRSGKIQEMDVVQSIGAYDIDGNEIWSCDIVESDYYSAADFICIAAIQYDTMDNQFGFKFDSGEQDAFRYGNLTIIGNIYENPELLDNNS